MKGDDYMKGRHFWTHFWIGLIVGGIFGARISLAFFDSITLGILCAVAIALVFALAVGYYGDPLWRDILRWWGWWF
jgi:Mg/Co/Ni transporter MgtE